MNSKHVTQTLRTLDISAHRETILMNQNFAIQRSVKNSLDKFCGPREKNHNDIITVFTTQWFTLLQVETPTWN